MRHRADDPRQDKGPHQVIDAAEVSRNHNYMNTGQGDSAPAGGAAGTDNDTNAGSETTPGRGLPGGAGNSGRGGTTEEVRGWFMSRLPGDWFTGAPDIQADREEITV